MIGFNTDLQTQMTQLLKILKLNEDVYNVLKRLDKSGFKNYYVGAGCIAQTVWNYQSGMELTNGISDIDFIYYDDSDLSAEAENQTAKMITNIVNPCKISLDINNQARVHLWYKEYFGYDISPYQSIESAINSWPTTATSIGVRLEHDEMKIYAPFGLNDMFGMIIRANKSQITEKTYMEKVRKWSSKWPSLTIIPWHIAKEKDV